MEETFSGADSLFSSVHAEENLFASAQQDNQGVQDVRKTDSAQIQTLSKRYGICPLHIQYRCWQIHKILKFFLTKLKQKL